MESYRNYKMTYEKSPKDDKSVERLHTTLDLGGEKVRYPERVRHLVKNNPKHKELISKGWKIHKYGSHDDRGESMGRKVNAMKEEKKTMLPPWDMWLRRHNVPAFKYARKAEDEKKQKVAEKKKKEVKEEKISLPTEYGGDHSVRQIYEGGYQLARGHAGSAFYGGGIKPSVADSPLRARPVAKPAARPAAKPTKPSMSVPVRKPAAPVAKPATPALSGGGTSGPPHRPPPTSSAPPLPQRKPTPGTGGGLPSPTTAKVVGPSATVGAGPAGIHVNPSPSRGPGTPAVPGASGSVSRDIGPSATVGAGPAGIHVNPSPSRGPGTIAKPPTSSISAVPGASGSVSRDIGPGNAIPSINMSIAPIQSQIPTGNMNLMPGATPKQSSMDRLKAIIKRGLP